MSVFDVRTIEDSPDLEAYDHTRLSDYNKCPTYGLIRRGMNLRMPGNSRAMALEAGTAVHEVLAAIRLVSLQRQGLSLHVHFHGERLFGADRWRDMYETYAQGDDQRRSELNMCLQALYNGPFYDDPRDKRRTRNNLEDACIAYYDKFDFNMPVWVEDIHDPESRVGIEIPYRIPMRVTTPTGTVDFAFTGRIDAIQVHKTRGPVVIDNKTASRLTDSWANSFRMSNQLTGYVVAARMLYDPSITWAGVHGIAIPQPKRMAMDTGIVMQLLPRQEHHFVAWAQWVVHTIKQAREYRDPLTSPRYTKSCDSYYRTCSMMPFCNSPAAEASDMLNEMELDIWNPLEETHSPVQAPQSDVHILFGITD